MIIGLLGVALGGILSLAGVFIQSYFNNRNEKIRLAIQVAQEDYKLTRERTAQKGGTLMPVVCFIHYHYELMKLLERNKLTSETVKALKDENAKIVEVIKQYCND